MKLTKTKVEKLPIPAEGQALSWDDDLAGFGARVTSGGARSYIVQGRVAGKTRRVTLGAHGKLTCEEARKRARRELLKLADGVEPKAERKRKAALAVTLRELADTYMRERRELKASSRADIEKHITRSLADWAERPVASITRDACKARFLELSKRSAAQANQCFRVLRALLNFARAAYRTPDGAPTLPENPVSVLAEAKLWNRVEPKSRRIPDDKIGAAWNVLQALRSDPGQTGAGHTGADVVAFLMLTGARWIEAAALTWDRVNLEAGSWHLADPKNRHAVTLPLATGAQALLANRPRSSDFVFPHRSRETHVSDARGTLEKVSEAAGRHVSAHDLRRTFRAIAGACGIELWKCKLLMNHISSDVTIRHYTETSDLAYLRPEAERIASWVHEQAAIAAAANVARLRRA